MDRTASGARPNVVFVTLDQFRGDWWSAAGHPVVRTPNLDHLARNGVRFARHYSQAAPCGPGRASLYTGMYQFNHRVVGNGSPLDRRFDNVALSARRAGYEPALFGYTDSAVDPRETESDDDPRLENYEGVLPGFDDVLPLVREQRPWREFLRAQGHDVDGSTSALFSTESDRPAEHSISAFMTDRVIHWLERRMERDADPWFVHLSYLRPHPPYAAAGHFATMYDPDDLAAPIDPASDPHPFHAALTSMPDLRVPDGDGLGRVRAQYAGMISEVDHQLGRLWAALDGLGVWDDTVIVVTSDHGEQLGDHGYLQKGGFFEQSYHVPAIVRDPTATTAHGTTVNHFTENVDLFPTLCDLMDVDVPVQCDGLPLTPFLRGVDPPWWRSAAHWEYDWRTSYIDLGSHEWPWDRRLERQHLAVRRDEDTAYVQFGDGSWRCFDLSTDPSWRTEIDEPERILPLAQEMLRWRSHHTDRTLADSMIEQGVRGRDPRGAPEPVARRGVG